MLPPHPPMSQTPSTPEPFEATTEAQNAASTDLDAMDARQIVALMAREDARCVAAVERAAPSIAKAIDAIALRLERGGRLFYFGAGTSGRLGVLDASECPPTFSTDPKLVIGLIAGGDHALRHPIEGAEDRGELGVADLRAHHFGAADVAVGITASGTAPYVLAAIEYAKSSGGATIGICCNAGAPLSTAVDVPIELLVGPEVLSGSTRLKAGTATKLALNMLSTGAMVRLGKCYQNLMVDLQASNQKLRKRAIRIVGIAAGLGLAAAEDTLRACDGEVKTAIVAARRGVAPAVARQLLAQTGGRVRQALALGAS